MSASAFVGSKISLISKSDVRYVGVLHSISTEEATVSLEQVRCFGTEGRKNNPAEELPASSNVYEFVVFRAADIKDLTVLEPPQSAQPPQPSSMPHDPAIVNSPVARPPTSQPTVSAQQQQSSYNAGANQNYTPSNNFSGAGQAGLPYGQRHPDMHTNANLGGPPAGMGMGHPNYPPQSGQHSMQSHPGHAHWQAGAAGGQGSLQRNPYGIGQYPSNSPAPPGMGASPMGSQTGQGPSTVAAGQPTRHEAGNVNKKPGANGASAALANSQTVHPRGHGNAAALSGQPVTKWDPKQGVITTTIPSTGSNAKQSSHSSGHGMTGQQGPPHSGKRQQQQQQQQHANRKDDYTESEVQNNKKFDDAAANDANKDQAARRRRGRRGTGQQGSKPDSAIIGKGPSDVDAEANGPVPSTEFDFESANAKFDKANLIKEFSQLGINVTNSAPATTANIIATTSPAVAPAPDSDNIVIPPASTDAFYDRSRSFFDDISCESKERKSEVQVERRDRRMTQERRVNMETFGQISIDGNARFRGGRRGGYRGRGHRGRGGGGGRGGNNNNNNNITVTIQQPR
ncbi:Scd6-like Sm domain-containing protein [Syncephalis fuscata]|nr:Scd6-like Sm domain-containing protein [Syncephalis fuscata]